MTRAPSAWIPPERSVYRFTVRLAFLFGWGWGWIVGSGPHATPLWYRVAALVLLVLLVMLVFLRDVRREIEDQPTRPGTLDTSGRPW